MATTVRRGSGDVVALSTENLYTVNMNRYAKSGLNPSLTRPVGSRPAATVHARPVESPRLVGNILRSAASASLRYSAGMPQVQCADHHAASNVPIDLVGRGPINSPVMMVGEQPGDREDLRGRPFVGPAGQLLRDILADLAVNAEALYLTNAVKHSKFNVRGKHRLQQRPSIEDVAACQPWLEQEIQLVAPKLIIALGATAARALLGRSVRVLAERGVPIVRAGEATVFVTSHPAYVLRQRNAESQRRERQALQRDLARAIMSLPAADRQQLPLAVECA